MTLYLNNDGSRWIYADKEAMKCILIHGAENYRKIRKVEYFESFGNFVSATLKYKGKRISILPDDIDDETGYMTCFVDYKEKYQ